MKSGLEDRNNRNFVLCLPDELAVSMKSGLEDRNNDAWHAVFPPAMGSVSMKSGLEDRNN